MIISYYNYVMLLNMFILDYVLLMKLLIYKWIWNVICGFICIIDIYIGKWIYLKINFILNEYLVKKNCRYNYVWVLRVFFKIIYLF